MSTNIRVEARLTTQVREALRARDGDLVAATGEVPTSTKHEQELLAQLVVDTLTHDLAPVSLIREDGPEVTGIEAWFADGSLMVVAVEAGELLTDQVDTSGECAVRQLRLEQGLAVRGVDVRRTAEDGHGATTGPLVEALAGAGRRNLAEAIATGTAGRIRPAARSGRARNVARADERQRQGER